MERHTHVSIIGEQFYINGQPTYAGRSWNGSRIEGLLMNSRMVQGIFDDLNPETRSQWAYADTEEWNPDRNTDEFIAAMPEWRSHGLLAMTLNLQGGSPQGYSKEQPWINSAIKPDGSLHTDYMARLGRILDRADELGMVVILGIFYFGQEKVLNDEGAILHAVDNTVNWLFDHDYHNILIEINNECNIRYEQPLLKPDGVHELILRARQQRNGRRFLVSTSYGGRTIPKPNVVQAADFILLHGNGVVEPSGITEMVRQARQVDGYRPMPVLFNEDDHFNFEQSTNNMLAAVREYASWGFFDYRMQGETDYAQGYQSVPVDWGINSERKQGFFRLLKTITDG